MSESTIPTRLEQLRARPRRPGLAALFWYEPQFGCEAVKVLPGEYFVDSEDIVITTTLGSCIAACLWDRDARIGGMNHFMLPGSADDSDAPGDAGRYGASAMEWLTNALLAHGASRATLEAKLFGGAQVIGGMQRLEVGERNARFALDYLAAERIPVVASDLLGNHARRVCFLPASGKAMVKRLAPAQAAGGVSVELFS